MAGALRAWWADRGVTGGSRGPATTPASTQLQADFGADSAEELQNIIAGLLLAEAIYKAAEGPPAAAAAALAQLRGAFPPGLAPLGAVQFSRRAAEHRYLLARGGGALFVAFMGSKHPRDYLADANLLTRLLWQDAHAGSGSAAGSSGGGRSSSADGQLSPSASPSAPPPAAHRGFLGRAAGVPIEALYAHARRQGLRLVLCGHSLGGAVAQLCTLRLLRALQRLPPPGALGCVAFGCPAIGNAALAEHVREQGWGPYLLSLALPEDLVPRLLLQAQPQAAAAPAAAAEAEAAANQEALAAAERQQHEPQQLPMEAGGSPAEQPGASSAEEPDPSPGGQAAGGTAAGAWWPAATASVALRAAGAARSAALGLTQRPWMAAANAVRSARSGAALQLLPAFSHIGQQRLLLPQGAVPAGAASLAAASVAAEPAAAASGGAPAAQRPWAQLQPLGLHSMRHYRSRAASLCWRALGQSQQAPAAAADPPIELSRSLAPPLLVQQAAAPLLVLQPSPPGSWQPYEAAVPLTVAVSGSGLELCTRALLQFPGAQLPALAATEVSLAKQQLLAVSQAAGSSSSDSSSALGRFRSAAGRALHRTQAAVQQEQAAQPDLLLRFVVPAAALQQLALQQRGPALHMPQAELTLLSDFGRQAASVQLQPAVVWAFGLDAAMSGAVVHRLQVAAADAAAAAAEQRWLRRPSLPSQAAVAAPLRGLWGGGMGGAGGTGGSSEPPSGAAEAGSAEPEPQQLSRLARLRQQATARAAERLAGLRQQWSSQHQPAAQAADSELPPTAVLLPSGVLLLDAAPALLGDSGSGGSVAQQLELAAGALQWSAQQRQQQHAAGPAAGQGSAALQRAGWEQEEQQQAGMEEVDEEELAELAQLGIGAKLRRQLARTAAAAQRRAALARHRRRQAAQLQALPPPDVVLLLLHHQQLLSSGFGEGLDGAVLAAVRQLAAACAACGGAPLLLAVASAAPLSTPYRWHLADACGLGEAAVDGSSGSSMRGSVVPLLLSGPAPGAWEPPAGSQAAAVEAARVEPLQAALHVYAARRQGRREQSAWQGAPRSRL